MTVDRSASHKSEKPSHPVSRHLCFSFSSNVHSSVCLSVCLCLTDCLSRTVCLSVCLSVSLFHVLPSSNPGVSFRPTPTLAPCVQSTCCVITMFSHLFTVDLIPAHTGINRPCNDASHLFGRLSHACMPRSYSPLPPASGKLCWR